MYFNFDNDCFTNQNLDVAAQVPDGCFLEQLFEAPDTETFLSSIPDYTAPPILTSNKHSFETLDFTCDPIHEEDTAFRTDESRASFSQDSTINSRKYNS